MSHYEETLSTETVFRGKILDIEHSSVRLENGKTAFREVATHPGAIGIVVMDNEHLILVRQYRYAVGKELTEIPAGKLEHGEEPEAAAIRELREETGLQADSLHYLGDYYASPGILGEVIHLYFAKDLTEVGSCPDEDEFVTVERITPADFEKMAAEGKICDGKTLSGYFLAKNAGLL